MKDFVDWILVSKEIRIENFEILSDDISDHYAVAATLHLNDTSGERGSAAH
jgi:endonuclease/exonuclease/phosphatase family metal-dependent hydrolase